MLRLVDPASGRSRTLPLADANDGAYSADGSLLWFVRFGAHVNGDNARDYRGGSVAQLWRWRADAEAQRIAVDYPGGLTRPMPWQGRVFAIGDAGGVANLWSLAEDGSDARALTTHREFQVRGASLHGGRIVYASGADLRLFDIGSGSDAVIPIRLSGDRLASRERFVRKPLDFLGSAHVSRDGGRVALSARGRVALASTGLQRRIDLSGPPQARLREAVIGAGGAHAYAIVDAQGRSEIWRLPADGSAGGEPLTRDGEVHRWRLYPSPVGELIAHDDKRGRLWLLDAASGSNRALDDGSIGGDDVFESVAWSPDGRHLAVVRADTARLIGQIVLIDSSSGRRQVLTSDRYESFAPVFSPDGRWLYFLSNRSFVATPQGPWGDRNTGPFFDRRAKLYALALQPGLRFPFAPTDELSFAEPEARPGESALPAPVWDGLAERLFEVPLPAGNFRELAHDGERLYLLERDAAPNAKATLRVLPVARDSLKLETLATDLAGFQLSADRKKLLLLKSPAEGATARVGEILLVDAAAKLPEDLARATVRVADWALALDPAAEWAQMFDDAWRMHRQFSFDAGMRGQDWDAVRARYAPLLARVGDRAELDELLAQMIAELGILHSQVRGGDLRGDPDAPQPATLGARYEHDDEGLRIARIYRSDPELPSERGPLARPGVDVREGDLLRAVNGKPVRSEADLARALRQQAGQQVLLTLRRGAAAEHRAIVQPVALARDAELRYLDWVQDRRARVETAGGGRIGYLHLRAMGGNDIASFVRDFYAQYDREGLIIDVRRNRGGNIDSWVIEKLLRRGWAFWQPVQGAPYWNMQQSFRGHLVVLVDALTYSDGETFAAGVKALDLGKVIGTRTAGAGIWLSDRNRLADNGIARIAEFGQFDAQGRWLIEGNGVAPDIEVDNLPFATAGGSDAQLEAAIAELQRTMTDRPLPPARAQPVPPRGTPGHDGAR
jgi:tricorn protease